MIQDHSPMNLKVKRLKAGQCVTVCQQVNTVYTNVALSIKYLHIELFTGLSS